MRKKVRRKLKNQEVIKERTGRVSGENKNEQGGDKRRETKRKKEIRIGRRKIEQKGWSWSVEPASCIRYKLESCCNGEKG